MTEGKTVTAFSSPPLLAQAFESAAWSFDDFVLDQPRYELRRNGIAIKMEPQVFDVLTQLVSNHHRLVTKNELLDTVWGGRFVTEAALSSRIKAARRALGDDGASQRYIRTVRGRGYQFIGTIIESARPEHAEALAPIRFGDFPTTPTPTTTDAYPHRRRATSHTDALRHHLTASTRRKALNRPPR